MVRKATAIAALAGSVMAAAPATAQEFKGIEALLDNPPVRFVIGGLNQDDERLKTTAERDFEALPVHRDGAFSARSFGGDTHRRRARRGSGSILDLFKSDAEE